MGKKPNNSYSQNTTFLLVILTAIAFACLGYWYGSTNPNGFSSVKVEDLSLNSILNYQASKTSTVSPSPVSSTAADETASWKTYTNEKYGYSFKYPSGWTETTLAESAQVIVSSADTADLVDKGKLHPAYANNLVITRYPSINEDNARGGSSVYMKETYANLDDYVSDSNALKKKTGETTIDGTTAYEVGIVGEGANLGVMLERNNSIYEFSFERKTSRSELSNEENLILSTFEFTK